MTGPAYVAYVPPENYQPRCHAHGLVVWEGERTPNLDTALAEANTHSTAEHAGTTSSDIANGEYR